jgi:hypothetical protein
MRVFVLLRESSNAPSDPIGVYATLEGAQRAAALSADAQLAWEADWNERWRAAGDLHDYVIYRLPLQARWERKNTAARSGLRRGAPRRSDG